MEQALYSGVVPYVSTLQRFSLDDGPGIRTTVFFKGCNLHCAWCHNPECIPTGTTLQFLENNCVGCGKCAAVCPQSVHSLTPEGGHTLSRSLCIACGKCVHDCPHGALNLIGSQYAPEELVNQLLRDRRYYETSGGGVTFSGGEPMLHPAYLAQVLCLCKKAELHTAVDTAGCVPFKSFETVLPWVDLFLYDIKLWDEERHRLATGVSNRRILENLRLLTDAGGSVFIRTPVIPGYNAEREELGHIAAFLAELPHRESIRLIQLLPYHSYGVGKYRSLGSVSRTEALRPPEDRFLQDALQLYLDLGLPAQIS